MTPSPVKRYRQKSRLVRGDRSADLRQKALEMAQQGLNRRGGPVDKGTPQAQKQAAERVRETANRDRVVSSHGGAPKAITKSGQPSLDPTASMGPRKGVLRRGPVATVPTSRRSPMFRRTAGPTEGTGNRTKPNTSGSQELANQLAKQRLTQNRPRARRKLFTRS